MFPLFIVTKHLSLLLYSGKFGSCTWDAPIACEDFVRLSSPVLSLSFMPPEMSMEQLKTRMKKYRKWHSIPFLDYGHHLKSRQTLDQFFIKPKLSENQLTFVLKQFHPHDYTTESFGSAVATNKVNWHEMLQDHDKNFIWQ